MNSFSFKDKDPRFIRLKPDLALRLTSKGLLYIRAMGEFQSNLIYIRETKQKSIDSEGDMTAANHLKGFRSNFEAYLRRKLQFGR